MPKINISVDIHESIYLKDPLSSSLGKKIIENAIVMIEDLGFEVFTFKKLAYKIESSEASIYRYFENKYNLLAYLVSWYWDFMHFMVLMDLRNLLDPKEKLIKAINTLVKSLHSDAVPVYIDHLLLHKVVVENASRVYHHKNVDKLSMDGYFQNYSKLITTLSEIILEVSKEFKYPIALATNIIEQSLNNEYYLEHLPDLTDKHSEIKNNREATIEMIYYMLGKLL